MARNASDAQIFVDGYNSGSIFQLILDLVYISANSDSLKFLMSTYLIQFVQFCNIQSALFCC